MKIGLIAIAGVKMQTRKFLELGITLPQFMNRGRVIAQLPSLALLQLAAATPQTVDVEYLEVDDFSAALAAPRRDFDLVALSTYTARAFETYELADAYRDSGVPVVIGGLHATVRPEEAKQHADAVAIGEGETLWPAIVSDFLSGGVKALQPYYREPRPGRTPLEHAPIPLGAGRTSGEDKEDTVATGQIHRLGHYNRVTIQTTRGCPWDCEFCAASRLYGAGYRTKPVERVLKEVDVVRSLWNRPFIEFADDNTFVNKAWSKQLLRGLAERDVRYFTETDVSVADDLELLDLLYPSGCRQVLIGFESPRQASLHRIDRINWKQGQAHRYLDAIEKIQSRGVSVCGCFIVGLDADTLSVFDDLRGFIETSRLLEVQVTILTPFPGTRLYERLQNEERLIYPGDWNRCTLFDLNYRPKGMTVDQLEEGVMSLWREIWNAKALSERKRHYRQILRSRRNDSGALIQPGFAIQHDDALPILVGKAGAPW